jgi:hypothetical protein
MSINQVEAQAKGTRQGLNKRTQLGRNQPAIYLHGPGKNEHILPVMQCKLGESLLSAQTLPTGMYTVTPNPLGRSSGERQAP